eukprot:839395-Pelagomonas_calceolata.AAC.6
MKVLPSSVEPCSTTTTSPFTSCSKALHEHAVGLSIAKLLLRCPGVKGTSSMRNTAVCTPAFTRQRGSVRTVGAFENGKRLQWDIWCLSYFIMLHWTKQGCSGTSVEQMTTFLFSVSYVGDEAKPQELGVVVTLKL